MRDATGESGRRRNRHVYFRRRLLERGLLLDLVFHTETLAFDNHGLGVMQQPVQDGGGQGAVMVEYVRPLLEGAVRGNNDRPLLIAQTR